MTILEQLAALTAATETLTARGAKVVRATACTSHGVGDLQVYTGLGLAGLCITATEDQSMGDEKTRYFRAQFMGVRLVWNEDRLSQPPIVRVL